MIKAMLQKIRKYIAHIYRFIKTPNKQQSIEKLKNLISEKGIVSGIQSYLDYLHMEEKIYKESLLFQRNSGSVVILTTLHCLYIANLIKYNLSNIGIEADIILRKPENGYSYKLHYVICPQIFDELPEFYIAFQLEQSVNSRWFSDKYFGLLNAAKAIFDYSLINVDFLLANEVPFNKVYYLPVYYFNNYCEYLNLEDSVKEEYDVLFYGDPNNSRRQYLLEMIQQHYSVKIVKEVFGVELYKELLKAKIIINLHYYEGALLETTRLYESLALDRLIISEKSVDQEYHAELETIIDFVEIGDVANMIDKIGFWLKNEQLRYEKIATNKERLIKLQNQFTFYFYRYLLSVDLITFDEFWAHCGQQIIFDKTFYCLSLPESLVRRKDFVKDNKYGAQIYNGLRHNLGWVGCGLSFKSLIKRAKEQNLEYIIICEDDVEFYSDFGDRLEQVLYYLNSHEGWGIFSGLLADLHPDTKILGIDEYNGIEYVFINKLISTVFNIYHKSVFDVILGWDERLRDPYTNTIDKFIESHDIKVVTVLPYLVGHKESLDSTIWGFQNTQYNELITKSIVALQQKVANYKLVKNK